MAGIDRFIKAVAGLDFWLDTMRVPGGYGGPVAHWWQQSLVYTGPGLDWRYEGIIAGYLELWERTGSLWWLKKAQRAGEDLLKGQLENGHFVASAFELNPAVAGTPHEVACDVGLLLLARALNRAGIGDWELYRECAERNLSLFYIGQLWDERGHAFRDHPRQPSFVPNKAATACEALFLLSEISGDGCWVDQYALPNLEMILRYQTGSGSWLDGAIAQNSIGNQLVEKYFPFYISRCIPALLQGYRWTMAEKYLDGALRAINFISHWIPDGGAMPAVIYADGRKNSYPGWIAASGDILRAADLTRPFGFDGDFTPLLQRLLEGQDSSGGIQTASGFAGQVSGSPTGLPDVRDVLHVAGWCDKAFRYLAAHTACEWSSYQPDGCYETECRLGGRKLLLRESPNALEITGAGTIRYLWHKGQPSPGCATEEFWLP